MKQNIHRIGLVVPSSNTTMEIEIPELLARQAQGGRHGFTTHSARLRLTQVTPEALRAMNASAEDAVDALCDAQVDAILYACLVAVMVEGRQGVVETGIRLSSRAAAVAANIPSVITSAGALIQGLQRLGARNVNLIAPYRRPLTDTVCATLAEGGIEVLRSHSLEVVDNVAVGRLDQDDLMRLALEMDHTGADALVLSACVQMPSLDIVEAVERRIGIPVITAATACVRILLDRLGISPRIPGAGRLLRSDAVGSFAQAVPDAVRVALR